MISLERGLHCCLAVMVCLAVAGCGAGEKRVTVTGKIVDGGQPLTFGGPEYEEGAASAEVTFHPLDDAGNLDKERNSHSTTAKPDGSFVMDGDVGDGILVGRYRVALRHRASSGYSPTAPAQGDTWAGKFDLNNSPFEFDIQSDQEIVLDISQAPAPESGP